MKAREVAEMVSGSQMIEGHHQYCSGTQIWSLKEKMREKISPSGGMISDGMGEGASNG
jgi:hypothetical protein